MVNFKLENISCKYGNKTVLHNINLDISKQSFIVLAGPSGCGKTSLLNAIAGFLPLVNGVIKINHKEIQDLPINKRNIAMVFQDATLFEHLRVYDNIVYGLQYAGVSAEIIKQRVDDISHRLKINSLLKHVCSELSGGEKQRVAIARALVHQPDLFLMDEPLSSLDTQLKNELRMEMRQLFLNENAIFLYVTHDQIEAMTLADILVIMDQGEIQQIGSPQVLYNTPDNLFVASFLGKFPINTFQGYIKNNVLYCHDKKLILQNQHEDREIIIGVREFNLIMDDSYGWEASIQLIEDFGDEYYYHIAYRDKILIMKGKQHHRKQLHETIQFSFNFRNALYFDAKTKLRFEL